VKPAARIRLSTLLLAMVILALLAALYAQHRREAQLQDSLAIYRHPVTEGIHDTLDQPLALAYPDGARLEDVLKEMKLRSTGRPKLPTGFPIYVDPIGLQEAERSMTSTVKRAAKAETLTLGEHLRGILNPLGLDYQVKHGFLMITSKESLDAPAGDAVDPYLQYRDILR
jgi:hypothetical protein